MKYVTKQQKILAIFMMFILSDCTTMNAAPVRGPIDHADSAVWLQEHFECDLDYARIIRVYLMNLDDALFDFLDFLYNKKKYKDHVKALEGHLRQFKAMIDKEKKNINHAHTVKKLNDMYKTLAEIYKHIKGASGKKGMVAAMNLGAKIKPLLDKFDNYLPITMNVEERLKRKYNTLEIAYLSHLRGRLDIQ